MKKRGGNSIQDKAECIAFTNPKGGSGKTTSCLSIAGYLAKKGKRVLVVDSDPQASATSGLGIDSASLHHTVEGGFCDGDKKRWGEAKNQAGL